MTSPLSEEAEPGAGRSVPVASDLSSASLQDDVAVGSTTPLWTLIVVGCAALILAFAVAWGERHVWRDSLNALSGNWSTYQFKDGDVAGRMACLTFSDAEHFELRLFASVDNPTLISRTSGTYKLDGSILKLSGANEESNSVWTDGTAIKFETTWTGLTLSATTSGHTQEFYRGLRLPGAPRPCAIKSPR